MNQIGWLDEWRSADLWSEADLQAICCGLEPDKSRSATDCLNKAAEKIRRAVMAKALPVAAQPGDATDGDRMYGHARFFSPLAATRWAVSKRSDFPEFPFTLEHLKGEGEQPSLTSTPHTTRDATYLNIIGALLEFVRSPRDGRDSDALVIRELIQNYGDKVGISKPTLEAKFAAARRQLDSP